MLACLGSQAWSNDESQMSNAKQLMKVKSNTSMHRAITVFVIEVDKDIAGIHSNLSKLKLFHQILYLSMMGRRITEVQSCMAKIPQISCLN